MPIPSEDDAVILMSAFHPEINAWRVGFHDTSQSDVAPHRGANDVHRGAYYRGN